MKRHDIEPVIIRDIMRHFIITTSGITMVIIVIAFLLALVISHRITLPIKNLTEGVREVADGNLDIQIPAQGHDEIAKLSNAFNLMVAQRKQAEQTISKSLAEKELLLKELHHRVKNNMAIITAMLNMQARRLEGEKNLRAFEDSRNRIMAMALVHEKLYQSENLSDIKVEEYFRSLTRRLMQSYGVSPDRIRITLNVHVDDIPLDKLIPCGLLVNELVSNSLKYAFETDEKGEIYMNFVSRDQRFILTVCDNGSGIPEDFDIDTTDTMGLQIVKSLAVQLRGELQLSRAEGTVFSISFPMEGNTSYLRGVR